MKKIDGGLDWLESDTAAVIGNAGASDVDLGQIAVACALGYLDFRFADVNWRATRPRLARLVHGVLAARVDATDACRPRDGRSVPIEPFAADRDRNTMLTVHAEDPAARVRRRDPVRRAARVRADADAGLRARRRATGDWRTASHRSAGLAPDPASHRDAVVQVYAARTFGWRGAFAVHTWLAAKPAVRTSTRDTRSSAGTRARVVRRFR